MRCETPNQHAPKPSLVVMGGSIAVSGYGEYLIENRVLSCDNRKFDAVKPYLTVENKRIADLGCANGLFSVYTALSHESNRVTAVDIDQEHLAIVEEISDKLGLGIETRLGNVEDFNEKVDVTVALALVHWVYSCTSHRFGSLDKVIEWLASFTDEYLIIEWVDAPNDTNVNFFKHTEYNRDIVTEAYTEENFDDALSRHFARVELVCEVSEFRKLYVAHK